jgi:hypothetical protein
MWLVRPLLYRHLMGIADGTQATTQQRVLSLFYMLPFYQAILLCVGTAFGRFHYVKTMVMRPYLALASRLTGMAGVKKKQ